jgi:hypothetical protein
MVLHLPSDEMWGNREVRDWLDWTTSIVPHEHGRLWIAERDRGRVMDVQSLALKTLKPQEVSFSVTEMHNRKVRVHEVIYPYRCDKCPLRCGLLLILAEPLTTFTGKLPMYAGIETLEKAVRWESDVGVAALRNDIGWEPPSMPFMGKLPKLIQQTWPCVVAAIFFPLLVPALFLFTLLHKIWGWPIPPIILRWMRWFRRSICEPEAPR